MNGSGGTAFAVIPARGGSKGIPGKNIRVVGGAPLVVRSIRAALAAGLDGVAVSTDSDAIAEVALGAGAEVIRRPAEISDDAASSEVALMHALDVLAEAGREPRALVFLQCTSPFFAASDIRAALDPVLAGRFDSVFSVTPDHGFLWRIGADGCAEGVNHDPAAPRRRRQDLEPQYRENGAIYAMRTSAFRRTGSRFCGRIGLAPTEIPIIELDTPADLEIVEAMAVARGFR